ncbi:L-aspartate oxidase, partial [Rhodobacteraceae bacterium WD3A24]
MSRLSTDRVVILGGGIGALHAALGLAPRPVLVISPEPLGTGASSAWAQGGVAAAIGPGDRASDHAADTERAGAGLVDPAIAARVTRAARGRIAALARLGTPFERDAGGGYALSREAAHGMARIVRVLGDQAGAAIMKTLTEAVRAAPSVQVIEGVAATALARRAGRVIGVTLRPADGAGAPVTLAAPAVLLAGGGA